MFFSVSDSLVEAFVFDVNIIENLPGFSKSMISDENWRVHTDIVLHKRSYPNI